MATATYRRSNLLVAASSAAGLPVVWGAWCRGRCLAASLVACEMVVYTLVHLAGAKYGPPDTRRFARHATALLWLDRAATLLASVCLLNAVAFAEATHACCMAAEGLVGLALLWRSERLPLPGYVPWQAAWHVLMYHTLYLAVTH